jgi:hypothetical protein
MAGLCQLRARERVAPVRMRAIRASLLMTRVGEAQNRFPLSRDLL